MPRPEVFTRRQFLQASAAAGAALAAGGVLGACSWGDGEGSRGAGDLVRITGVAVHPAIGVARVGSSVDSFFFGPEVPGALPRPVGGFKDADGAMARQAARFRLYGLDAGGRVVRELTAADGPITWTVNVANAKAAWYDVDVALDLPVARPVGRRNAAVTGADRAALVVAPGPRSTSGVAAPPAPLDGGRFLGEEVPLGELLTDEHGRLVFLPGPGRATSPGAVPLTTYSDNDGWVDDTCDGPVLASIELAGRTLEAQPAWVVVAPPNYGPGLAAGLVSADDSARLGWAHLDPGARAAEATPVSFVDEVLPVFARLVDMQWVNAGALALNGWGTEGDHLAPASLERLADASPANAAHRRAVYERFRDPAHDRSQPDAVPQMYGDGVAIPAQTAYQWLAVTPIQHRALERWADGDFRDDRDDPRPTRIGDVPVPDQPEALDAAGLASCLGGAYHPGIELPWALRVPSLWAAPRRLRMRTFEVDLATDLGDALAPAAALAPGGPLDGCGPGDLTRWQGVPWQSDAASCRSGYDPAVSPVLPTFWPARIPNHVLREEDYRVVVDTSRPLEERRAAFERRYDWERFVAAADREQALANMVGGWDRLGVVATLPGPVDGAFPAVMKVETLVGFPEDPQAPATATAP